MTFEAQETSVEAGQPIDLFSFQLGALFFRYTSAEDEITVGGNTYTPIAIKRSRLESTKEQRRNQLEISVPGNNTYALKYVTNVPSQRPQFLLYQYHRNDGAAELRLLYSGLVDGIAFSDDFNIAKIRVLPQVSALSRAIPRNTFQGMCNHVLYDDECGISDTANKFTGTVTGVSGNVITVPGANGLTNGRYNTGFVRLTSDTSEVRLIVAHSGNDITVNIPFPVTVNGQSVDLFPGCDHLVDGDCQNEYSNVTRFGGFPQIPTKNPFRTGL